MLWQYCITYKPQKVSFLVILLACADLHWPLSAPHETTSRCAGSRWSPWKARSGFERGSIDREFKVRASAGQGRWYARGISESPLPEGLFQSPMGGPKFAETTTRTVDRRPAEVLHSLVQFSNDKTVYCQAQRRAQESLSVCERKWKELELKDKTNLPIPPHGDIEFFGQCGLYSNLKVAVRWRIVFMQIV